MKARLGIRWVSELSCQRNPRVSQRWLDCQVGDWLEAIGQGCLTLFHPGPHQPRGCLQRAECNLGRYKCNYSLTRGKELGTAAK